VAPILSSRTPFFTLALLVRYSINQCLSLQFLTTHANYAAYVLRLPRRSKITTYFKLFLSFFISGFIHFLGDYMYTHTLFGGAISYFMLHACAITLEDMVIVLGKRMGLKESLGWRLVGYAWVAFIFTMLLPEWSDARSAILTKSYLQLNVKSQ